MALRYSGRVPDSVALVTEWPNEDVAVERLQRILGGRVQRVQGRDLFLGPATYVRVDELTLSPDEALRVDVHGPDAPATAALLIGLVNVSDPEARMRPEPWEEATIKLLSAA